MGIVHIEAIPLGYIADTSVLLQLVTLRGDANVFFPHVISIHHVESCRLCEMHLCWMIFLQIFYTDCTVCDQYRVLFRVGSPHKPQPLPGPSTRVLD